MVRPHLPVCAGAGANASDLLCMFKKCTIQGHNLIVRVIIQDWSGFLCSNNQFSLSHKLESEQRELHQKDAVIFSSFKGKPAVRAREQERNQMSGRIMLIRHKEEATVRTVGARLKGSTRSPFLFPAARSKLDPQGWRSGVGGGGSRRKGNRD